MGVTLMFLLKLFIFLEFMIDVNTQDLMSANNNAVALYDNKFKRNNPVTIENIIFGVDTTENEQCHIPLTLLWRSKVGSGVHGSPISLDMGGDGHKEIVVVTDEHYVEVLEGEDGHKTTGWPFAVSGASMVARPLSLDVTGDGNAELLISTVGGEIIFLTQKGRPLYMKSLKVPPLRVRKDWYEGLDSKDVHAFISLHNQKEESQQAGPSNVRHHLSKPKHSDKQNNLKGEESITDLDTSTSSSFSSSSSSSGDNTPHNKQSDTQIWQGFEGWLPEDGVQSLQLFLPTDTPKEYVRHVRGAMDPRESFQYRTYMVDREERDQQLTQEERDMWVYVDAHILASPSIADLDNDGHLELIVPVSYYFDHGEYANARDRAGMGGIDLDKYVGGGVVVFDIESSSIKWTTNLRLTTDHTLYRGHIYGSPTIVDLNGDGMLEVVVADAVGGIYVLDYKGNMSLQGFPQMMDAIYSQVAAEDVNGDGRPELVAMDINSNVACFDMNGKELWTTRISGVGNHPPVLGDINMDGVLDIIIATDAGHVWVLSGDSGLVLPNFPVKLEGRVESQPILVPLSIRSRSSFKSMSTTLHIVVAANNGLIYIIDPYSGCSDSLDIGEPMFGMPLVDDFSGNGRLDLVVATSHGNVYCIGSSARYHPLKTYNGRQEQGRVPTSRHNWYGVFASSQSRNARFISGDSFEVELEIVDKRAVSVGVHPLPCKYNVSVDIISEVMQQTEWRELPGPGSYSITLNTPSIPQDGAIVRITMQNEFGLTVIDEFSVAFHVNYARTMKWLVILPFFIVSLFLIFQKELTSKLPLLYTGESNPAWMSSYTKPT